MRPDIAVLHIDAGDLLQLDPALAVLGIHPADRGPIFPDAKVIGRQAVGHCGLIPGASGKNRRSERFKLKSRAKPAPGRAQIRGGNSAWQSRARPEALPAPACRATADWY